MMSSLAATRPQRAPLVAPGQIDHHAADMAVTLAADVTLEQAQRALSRAGQWLALDGDPQRPMGWLMQHDSTGPLRLGYGGWRDLATGVQFTDGRGELVTAGGITVKNVAGYDLVKFMVGSHGCFGKPVTIVLRTYRRPEAALWATMPLSGGAVRAMLESEIPPQWMLWTQEGLRAGWLGRRREVAALRPQVEAQSGGKIEQVSHEEDETARRRLLEVGTEVVRLYVAPAELAVLAAEARLAGFVADPVFGVVWMRMPEQFSDVLSVLRRRGGHATWLGRDGVRIYGVGEDAQAVLGRLKHSLDPEGILPRLPFSS